MMLWCVSWVMLCVLATVRFVQRFIWLFGTIAKSTTLLPPVVVSYVGVSHANSLFRVDHFFCFMCFISCGPIGLVMLFPNSGVLAFRSPIVICIVSSFSSFCVMCLRNLFKSSPLFVGLQYAFVSWIDGSLSGFCIGVIFSFWMYCAFLTLCMWYALRNRFVNPHCFVPACFCVHN